MFWDYYKYIAIAALLIQVLYIILAYRNYRFVCLKSKSKINGYAPFTLLTVPCKGIDHEFTKNISAFFNLNNDNHILHFVVESELDPAYQQLHRLIDRFSQSSKARVIRVFVAGKATGCSQKIHNLLYSVNHSPSETKVYAFADSDACPHPNWLSQLIYPLKESKRGATTGYRWFVPSKSNLATLALSAINAKVTQLLGNTHFNHAWGGSMAIRASLFRETGLDKTWQTALSDDFCLSRAVKKAHKKVAFVPACLIASYEQMNWAQLFEFTRRQLLITRVIMPGTWLFGLFSVSFSILGLGLGAILTIIATATKQPNLMLFSMVPIFFLLGQTFRAILRQNMMTKLLPDDVPQMKKAMIADIVGAPLWSWVLLISIIASTVGRTITWRGIKYKLIGPTETEILK
jgi:ceramide glucosyltransferase